jgi:hypothetical protein
MVTTETECVHGCAPADDCPDCFVVKPFAAAVDPEGVPYCPWCGELGHHDRTVCRDARRPSSEREINWDRIAMHVEFGETGMAAWRSDTTIRKPKPLPKLNRREALLAHYATREPTDWFQYDLAHFPGGDGLAGSDENGDIAYSATTSELWTGAYEVRVHVRRGLDRETAARLVRKALAWIEDGHLPETDPPDGSWPTAGVDPMSGAFKDEPPF